MDGLMERSRTVNLSSATPAATLVTCWGSREAVDVDRVEQFDVLGGFFAKVRCSDVSFYSQSSHNAMEPLSVVKMDVKQMYHFHNVVVQARWWVRCTHFIIIEWNGRIHGFARRRFAHRADLSNTRNAKPAVSQSHSCAMVSLWCLGATQPVGGIKHHITVESKGNSFIMQPWHHAKLTRTTDMVE